MMAKVSLECALPQGVLESHAVPFVVVWEPRAALQSRVGGQFGRCLTPKLTLPKLTLKESSGETRSSLRDLGSVSSRFGQKS